MFDSKTNRTPHPVHPVGIALSEHKLWNKLETSPETSPGSSSLSDNKPARDDKDPLDDVDDQGFNPF